MVTLEQERARLAYEHVSAVREIGDKEHPGVKKYAASVHSLPALLQSAGLCQALHFIHARRDDPESETLQLVRHLAHQLRRVDGTIAGTNELLNEARSAELSRYIRLSREASRCAAWYRRMVQGVLGIEHGEADNDRDD